MVLTTFWKKEFRLELFGIDYNRPSQFVLCQWQKKQEVHVVYLVYRWLFAGYFFGSLIASIREPGSGTATGAQYIHKWPIYLTNWGYLTYSVQAILGAVLVTQKFMMERKADWVSPKKTEMPRTYQMYWVLHSVATDIAFGVTIMYWIAIYDPALHTLNAINLIGHAFNSVFMIVDFFLVSHPFRLLHFYWPISFVTVYLAFTIVYYELDGTDRRYRPFIYPILNWQNGVKSTIVCVGGLVFLVVIHVVTWSLFLLRRWVYKRCVLKEGKPNVANDGMPQSVTSSSIHLDVTGF